MAKSEPMGIADGEDVAQGSTTDAAWVAGSGTVISLLKKIAGAGGGGGGGPVTIADGADVAEGTTTDAATSNTVVGLLKAIKAAVQGTLTVATHAVTKSGSWPLDTAAKGTTTAGSPTSGALDANTQPLHVSLKETITQPVTLSGSPTVDTELPAAAAATDADANPSAPAVKGLAMAWDSTLNAGAGGWFRVPGTVAAGLKVQSAQLPAALDGSGFLKTHEQGVAHVDDNAASLTVDAPVATPVFVRLSDGAAALVGQKTMANSLPVALASDESALQVVGNVANAVADSGNPVKTGGKATFPALPTLVATGQRVDAFSDLAGATVVRKRPVPMYTAVYRLTTATVGPRALTPTLVANTAVQIATIYHLAAATKRVQVKYVMVSFMQAQNAEAMEWEIQRLSATTAPATGNPAITPGKHDTADAAAEVTCLALPTTQGSLAGTDSPLGATIQGEVPAFAAPPQNTMFPQIVLWDSRSDGDGKDLILRAGIQEGFAVTARGNAAGIVYHMVTMVFTEE